METTNSLLLILEPVFSFHRHVLFSRIQAVAAETSIFLEAPTSHPTHKEALD